MTTPSRPIQSCFQCRKRKIKCNRSYPCAPCILRGESDACREVDKSNDTSKSTTETIEELLHRVSALEAAVLKLSDASTAPPVSGPNHRSHLPSPSVSPLAALDRPSVICSSLDTDTTDEDAAMMLEDFAMGHRVNQTRATQGLDVIPLSSINRSPKLEVTPHGLHFGVPDGHPLALLIDPGLNIMDRLISPMLPQTQTQSLIRFYFDRLDWYSKVLHRPSFLMESRTLMINIVSRNLGGIRIGFLGLHYMVLCIALHLIEPAIHDRLGLTFTTASEIARRMYSAAQACLYYDEFVGSHSLEHLQCIVLMGLYQQNLDESDTQWALMGTAIKIAQNLGISRLGAEGERDLRRHPYPAAWRSLVQREVARRVWGMLLWADWSNAAAHNMCYSIHPAQNHTGFPANINDDDLSDTHPFAPQPAHTYTEMTFSLCRLRFVELYRQIVDNMLAPSPAGYGFVLDMDRKISSTILELPLHFQGPAPTPELGGVKSFELTLALIMGETRRLRLHRPYLFRGYRERKYAASRVQCVNSATAILDYLQADDKQAALLLRWWLVLFYGFAATVVLFIDLCHQKAEGRPGPDLEIRRVQLRDALDLFKTAEHVSAVSRNAITLLHQLLAVEPSMPARPLRKRGASDDEPFERVVKRLIMDASHSSQGSYPSPSSYSASASPIAVPVDATVTFGGSPLGVLTPPSTSSSSGSPIDFGAEFGSDLLLSGALFREDDMFAAGAAWDEQTMAQISQLLYNDPYGFVEGGVGTVGI